MYFGLNLVNLIKMNKIEAIYLGKYYKKKINQMIRAIRGIVKFKKIRKEMNEIKNDNDKIKSENENLVDNNEQTVHELKERYEDYSNNGDNSKTEEIPKEVQMYITPINRENIEEQIKKDLISETESEAGQPIGKKEMDAILLNLNPYWIELIGSIGFTASLIIYESLGLIGLSLVANFFGEKSFTENLTEAIYVTYDALKDLGLKWLFFIALSQHLSVGFFCLTTFSNMFQEIKNIKKFFIVNFIKVALFYVLSVIILKFCSASSESILKE